MWCMRICFLSLDSIIDFFHVYRRIKNAEKQVQHLTEQLEQSKNEFQKDEREMAAIKSAMESVNAERKHYEQRILELREELLAPINQYSVCS